MASEPNAVDHGITPETESSVLATRTAAQEPVHDPKNGYAQAPAPAVETVSETSSAASSLASTGDAANTGSVGPAFTAEEIHAKAEPASAPPRTFDFVASAPQTPGVPGMPVSGGAPEPADEEIPDPDEMETLMGGYGDFPSVHVGELCSGVVVSIGPGGVVIDIGGKTEGLAPVEDFHDRAGDIAVKEGQEIEVFVESRGALGEYASLSYRRAQQSRIWNVIEEAERTGAPVQAEVTGRVKGGLSVDVGISAFLPGSQVDLKPARDLDALIGQFLPVRIVKSNKRRGNIVVSRRSLLEEERDRVKKLTLEKIEEGAVVTGTIKNVTDYGAFVDLGGIDGLIHVTDISYGRIKGPSEVLRKGQQISAKVLQFDKEKEKVSLSLKHMQPDPWEGVSERYMVGEKATGKVASLSDYGVFVELESGVEGLVHASELTWSRRRRHPSKLYKAGDPIEVMVLGVKQQERRISISVKHLQPDPWFEIEERLRPGTIVEGRVRNLASYGAFMEIEEGVDGLIHVSDLSWDQKAKNPQDVLKKGEIVKAVVLSIDKENQRLSLGLKQLQPNVWETFFSTCVMGDIVTGRVTRRAKFGCFVELAEGVEGLCHNLEMPKSSGQKKKDLQVGQTCSFRVIKLEEFERRIGLSRRNVEDSEAAAATG
ncbi:MAG: 30S ribosomal protein S1 [Acidobacteria bacterium]|nr:30S ribosomal protein S1 [Acidobacteriota bacterium]